MFYLCIISPLSLYMILHLTVYVWSHWSLYIITHLSQHTDSLVLVSGVAIGDTPVTVTQDKKKRDRPPKNPDESSRHSYKKRTTRLCTQCVSSNRSETSKTCKGIGGAKFCQYLNSQDLGLHMVFHKIRQDSECITSTTTDSTVSRVHEGRRGEPTHY